MVAKNPDDRFQSAGELLVEIRNTRERLDQPLENIDTSQQMTPMVIETESPTLLPANGQNDNPTSAHVSAAGVFKPVKGYIPPAGVGMPRGVANPALIGIKHHRGKTMLTFGVISLLTSGCLIGGILGMITWIYANSDLKEMAIGLRDSDGRGIIIAGKVLGIIGVVFAGLTFVGSIIGAIFN